MQSSKKVTLSRLKNCLSPPLQSWFSRVSAFHWALKSSKIGINSWAHEGVFWEVPKPLEYLQEREKYDQEFQYIEKYNLISFLVFLFYDTFFSANHCWSCVAFIHFLTFMDWKMEQNKWKGAAYCRIKRNTYRKRKLQKQPVAEQHFSPSFYQSSNWSRTHEVHRKEQRGPLWEVLLNLLKSSSSNTVILSFRR